MNRTLRAVLGLALVWGAGWALLGWWLAAVPLVAAAHLGAFGAGGVPLPTIATAAAWVALEWGVWGAAGGVLFAAALRWSARRAGPVRSVDRLSARRAAGWGGAVGALLAAVVLALSAVATPAAALAFAGLVTLFGMASGGGAVAIAQRPAARSVAARGVEAVTPGT